MPVTMNILDSYYLAGIQQGLSPAPTFFRDRYFPTAASDIFAADKVLVEYRDGDTQMAPFMVERANPIEVARKPYEIHDYSPVKLANSRALRIDDLKKRGFGEAILTDATEAERATRLIMEDLQDLNRRFDRSEEWLCAQTIQNNGFSVDEMIDKNMKGNTATVAFYDVNQGNDAAYTISPKWDASGVTFMDIAGDIRAMCRMLSERGLPVADLILGVKVADVLLSNSDFRDVINKTSGLIVGTVEEALGVYDGISYLGTLNFHGYRLNCIVVDERYKNSSGVATNYFPANAVAVTAPNSGHLMYAHITHITEAGDFVTLTGKRIPDLFVDRRNKTRELILESRPFAAPQSRSPWIFAANAVTP